MIGSNPVHPAGRHQRPRMGVSVRPKHRSMRAESRAVRRRPSQVRGDSTASGEILPAADDRK